MSQYSHHIEHSSHISQSRQPGLHSIHFSSQVSHQTVFSSQYSQYRSTVDAVAGCAGSRTITTASISIYFKNLFIIIFLLSKHLLLGNILFSFKTAVQGRQSRPLQNYDIKPSFSSGSAGSLPDHHRRRPGRSAQRSTRAYRYLADCRHWIHLPA